MNIKFKKPFDSILLNISVFTMAALFQVNSVYALDSRMMENYRVAEEIKKVLVSEQLKITLNGHLPTEYSYSIEKMSFTAGSCQVEVGLRVIEKEHVVRDDSGNEDTVPRKIEPVIMSSTNACGTLVDPSTQNYPYGQWIKIIGLPAFFDFNDELELYLTGISQLDANTLKFTLSNGEVGSINISRDILPNLSEFDKSE